MADLETRKALSRDLDALVELRAEMFRAMGVADDDGSWQHLAREWFAARLDDARFGIFVIEPHGQRVVACAMAAIRDAAPSPHAPTGRDVLISNVCTTPEFRGRGYGRAAFEAAMQWAQRSGVSRAELMATQDGRTLYTRAGFTLTRFPAMRAPLLSTR